MKRFCILLLSGLMALATSGLVTEPASAIPTPANSTDVISPVVVLPKMATPVAIALGNTSKVPVQVRVQFNGWCWDKDYVRIAFATAAVNVTVPGDASDTPGLSPLRRVAGTLTIPASCVPQDDIPGLATHDGEFFADMGPTGEPVQGSFAAHFWLGKPFTLTNIRYNLGLKTHQTPADSQAHHTLPQKYRTTFSNLGIAIDDPAQMRWWCSKAGVATNHQSKASAYNSRWDVWFKANPSATKAQVLAFRDSIQHYYTYSCPGVAGYPGFP